MICDARLTPQSPTNVCTKCYHEAQAYNNTQWLPWLECARPLDHATEDRIKVIVSDDHKLVQVAEIPPSLLALPLSQLSLCKKVNQPKGCSGASTCNSAHSQEELEYWKWSKVHNSIQQRNVRNSYSHLLQWLFLCVHRFPSTIPSAKFTATLQMRDPWILWGSREISLPRTTPVNSTSLSTWMR